MKGQRPLLPAAEFPSTHPTSWMTACSADPKLFALPAQCPRAGQALPRSVPKVFALSALCLRVGPTLRRTHHPWSELFGLIYADIGRPREHPTRGVGRRLHAAGRPAVGRPDHALALDNSALQLLAFTTRGKRLDTHAASYEKVLDRFHPHFGRPAEVGDAEHGAARRRCASTPRGAQSLRSCRRPTASRP